MTASRKTNLFNSPSGKPKVVNAPLILFEPEANFTISAKVTGKLKAVYDVAALVVYQDDETWAKFCYENSVNLMPTIDRPLHPVRVGQAASDRPVYRLSWRPESR